MSHHLSPHFLCCIFASILLYALPFQAMAQEGECTDIVEAAEDAFFNVRFEEAAILLEDCLPDEPSDQLEEAYFLLSRIYYATQDFEKTEFALIKLLGVNPDYSLEGPLPPPYTIFFENVRKKNIQHHEIAEQLRPVPDDPRPSFRLQPHLYWLGGGILLASTAAILIDIEEPEVVVFPSPPGPPGSGTQ